MNDPMDEKLYVSNRLSAPKADIERCAGACEKAAKVTDNHDLKLFLYGCGEGVRELLTMESGDTPRDFLNRTTIAFQQMEMK